MTPAEDWIAHYEATDERDRLTAAPGGRLEFIRTQELLARFLPPPPAVILDVGGAAGIHAAPLATNGYEIHLIDPVPLHVEQASAVPGLASATIGDARNLDRPDASVDAVLLLGPLYHLTERADRVAALAEARRVLRLGGVVAAAIIVVTLRPLMDCSAGTCGPTGSRRWSRATSVRASTATPMMCPVGSPLPTATSLTRLRPRPATPAWTWKRWWR